MSKKFTSFVVLLAALLLTLPAQAQTLVRKSPSFAMKGQQAITLKQQKAAKAAQQKALDKTVGIAFRGGKAAVEAPVTLTAEEAKAQKEAWAARNGNSWNWQAHAVPQYVSTSGLVKADSHKLFAALAMTHKVASVLKRFDGQSTTSARRAAAVDANGIITAPDDGESKMYTRAGSAYYVSSGSVYTGTQSGHVEIVECADGTVYIKDIVSNYTQGAWVKGTKAGNTITVAGGQPVAFNTQYQATLSVNWGNINAAGNSYERGEGDITFTIDGDVITLDGSSQDKIIAIFWDDDNTWTGYGDYETVWTLDAEYEPASTELVQLPEGATVEQWYAEGTGSDAVPANVNVSFVGDEVYVGGLCTDFPDAWIKGTVSGNTVTFSSFQFVGFYGGSTPIWAVGADVEGTLTDSFTMTYDAEAKTLTLDADQYLVFNAAEDRMYYLSYLATLALYAEAPAPAVVTVPYVNGFDGAEQQNHFKIIDANEDGRTWAFYNDMVRYTYSDVNAANDWLVSPQVYLTAGKQYIFSIAAHNQQAGYNERLEVKAALAPESLDEPVTAELLAAGVDVIPATDITSPSFKTFENNAFTVAESGFYYIGVHAISDANQWYLTVDDFSLTAGPIAAPYTADFSTEDAVADFQILDANGDATEDGNGTWNWSSTNGAYYKYSSANAADDYLILPIILEGGKGYDVTINAASNGAYYPEKFEVVWGLAPTKEALTNVIIPETTLSSDIWADFQGSFKTEEAGQYYVAIHAISDADQFLLKVMKMSIEVGAEGTAPAAVEGLQIAQVEGALQTSVSFTAPTKSVDGNELTANLTKIDLVRNEVVVKSFEDVAPGAAIEYVDELPAMGSYAYQVIPYNADGIGVKSEIIRIFAVTAVDVPYAVDFTQAGCLDFFQVIDANEDGKTWGWGENQHAYCDYSTDLAANDYLVSLPINLKAGKNYDITLNANAYSDAYPERLEVVLGNAATAEALTTVILPAVELTSSEPQDFTGVFSVEADGAYYIAIHAISDANQWYPVVNSLAVELGAEPQAPAAPALAVQPADEGALKAAVSVVAPTTTAEGKSLIGKVDVDILVNGETHTTLQGVTVGTEATVDVEVTESGVYTFQAVASNRYGKGLKSEKVSAFIGVDTPADVENFQIVSTTANTVTFAWDEVKGVHGGYVNPATMLYEISTLAVEEGFFGAYLVVDQTIASVTGQTQLTVDFAGIDEGDLAYQYFGISANDGVAATDATYAYTYLLKGAPYELPVVEGFANSTLHYAWESNGGLGVSNESSDEDGVALQLYNEGAADDIYFSLQKVNVVPAANPTLLFDVKSGSVDKIAAIGSVDGAEMQTIAEADVTEEYTTVKVPLTNLKGQRYTSVGLLANMPEFTEFDPWSGAVISMGDYVVIDNIRIVDLYEYDLKVALKAPASVKAGEKATITATVTNEGENAAEGYNIVIKAGEKELLNTAVNEVLEPFKSNVIEAELETTIFDDAADVTITAEVSYELDLNEENNSAETIVSIKESSVAQPETVAAQEGENGVELTWTAPETSAAEQVEDVEAYEEFDCGGLSAEVHTGKIGEWTVYDGNGTYNYGFNGLTVPNLGEPNAWIVMAPASAQLAQDISADYGAHSGGQYFMSACTAEPESAPAATDHWLISPELPGIAQTISFYARELTTNYGAETYEVLASATDTDAASFTVVATGAVDASEWTLYTAELPAGTKYFAIRHTSVDVFGMMVDDITYLAGAAEVTAFNIYVDGELFATVSGDVTTYTVGGLSEGEHTFAISAVTASGESKPVEVVLSVVTAIQQIAAEGQPVDVYSLDGKLVRKQTKSLNGLKGVYVINGKAVIVK